MIDLDAIADALAERIAERLAARLAPAADALLDAREAGELLGLGRRAVLAAIARGELRAVRVGRAYRMRRADVLTWATSRAVEPRPARPTVDAFDRALARGQLRRGGR